ncbi:acetyltransferase [Podospora conica]|nr:acetyltransferase [Schizothecium conicum]
MAQANSEAQAPTIRHATLKDIEVVTQLVRDLADSVGLLDQVQATTETLASTLCLEGEDDESPGTSAPSPGAVKAAHTVRPARCLLLTDRPGGTVVGFAVYFYTYSTWLARPGVFLEDLFVRPHERGKGYGTRLLAEVAKAVEEVQGGRLDWDVLKWNEKALRFYESLGAKRRDEWVGMRLEGDALRSLTRLES